MNETSETSPRIHPNPWKMLLGLLIVLGAIWGDSYWEYLFKDTWTSFPMLVTAGSLMLIGAGVFIWGTDLFKLPDEDEEENE